MSRSITLFLLSLALLSLTAPVGATVIYVSGDQTGAWAADTVIVTAEVRVPPGQSLTIIPGVEVLFSVYCKLIVDNGATLRAVGTSADSIRFDVLPPNANWHGIRFLSASDSSRLEYCHLTHGHATGTWDDYKGGAIYCYGSSPTISSSTISANSSGGLYGGYGGGIYCLDSSPIIISNTINGNSTSCGWGGASCGGGICCENSIANISGNTISQNWCFGRASAGGGIVCSSSSPSISNNTIEENEAEYGGGIICAVNSNPTISGNIISGNSPNLVGGGIHCENSSPIIIANTITTNGSYGYGAGGGISCWYNSNATLINNTICGNSADMGGGISCSNSSPSLVNCILWGNGLQQIYVSSGSPPQVTYSDIQGGYAGTGNISTYPAFVDTAQHDYRLQWGSPCIDTGDPNPIYNDPDNTRADMGAWYYDQSMPVRILLTPYNAPIQIPATGGSFQYNIQVTNIASTTLSVLGWCDVTLPSGTIYGPVLGPLNITLAPGQTLSRVRTQAVPANAPAGLYHYNAYAVAAGDTSTDSFTFVKLGGGGRTPALQPGSGGWTNTGEEFYVGARHAVPASESGATPTTMISPNPFNPTTAISFKLQAASYVSLRVYDTAGRLVATLVEGWREAGEHRVTFDGSGLPSGVYFARLTAGEFTQIQKLALLK